MNVSQNTESIPINHNLFLDQPVVVQQQLLLHLNLVIKANETTNITRISSQEEAMILHIEDSLSGIPEILSAPTGYYADIGSGAGYPGIPIALATGRKTTLIDSVGKKVKILNGFIEELEATEFIEAEAARIEEYALNNREKFSVISARALSKLGVLLELSSPLLAIGGRLVCFKSHVDDEELQHAIGLNNKTGMKLVSDREYYLSDGETYRRILVFEKKRPSQIKLPRRNGLAQKNPL